MKRVGQIILTVLLTLVMSVSNGQDTLVTLKNDILQVNVLEVDYSKELVKFKKTSMPNGPNYSEYLSNLFMIKIQGAPAIYNDPYENPYPGYQSIVPISMKRLERYSPAEFELDKGKSLFSITELKKLDVNDGELSSAQIRFDSIFNNVLNATKRYCLSRNFTIVNDFRWEYVYLDCSSDSESVGACSIHTTADHFSRLLNNASSVGNGKFLFSEFFLDGLNDDVIAGIIAHEIGHALAMHSLEQRRKEENLNDIANWTALGATLARGGGYWNNRSKIEFVGQAFFLKPYERNQETEADKIGAVLMSLAGYDPYEVVKFWRTGSRATRTYFLNDHPGGIERANFIENFIKSPEFQILTKKR